ncbi:hypothetical protein ACJJTC_008963 [Scirpophaga incertulas]
MILKEMLLCVLFIIPWMQHVQGVSFSKVYVQSSGSDNVDIATYGAPTVYSNAQIARLSAAPIGSMLPAVSNVIPPCVSPCVLPTQNIAPVAPVTNAKIITYNTPNVPVVVAPSKDKGYEYSYVVYDENTGDQKAQRESSDGAVVRGEYSFIQPDGYVREVHYTADDLTGFNVIVKKILPDPVNNKDKKPEAKEKSEPAPCPHVKSEALKAAPEYIEKNLNDDIELNIVKPEPTTKSPPPPPPPPAPKVEVAKVTESKTSKENNVKPPKSAEPIKPKEAVTVKEETKKEEVSKPSKKKEPSPQQQAVVPYDDIIRCIQSKIQGQQTPVLPNISPLTYIILPSGRIC